MVRQLRSTVSLTTLARYSVELYSRLGAETGQESGWRQCGSLSIATSPDRLEHIRRQATLANYFGIDAFEVGPDRVRELWPVARLDDVIGGVWSPLDGRVNPSDTCAALIRGAMAHGARVFEETPVTGFKTVNGRIAGVRTTRGDIDCEAVALCAGLWSRDLGAMLGVDLPLHACEHYAMITQAVPGMKPTMPILGDHDNNIYIREEVGGLLIGCFEPNAVPVGMERLPPGFSFDLLNEDWEHFEPVMKSALRRIPALEKVGIRKLINGPESFTPDDRFMIGEVPTVANLYVCCGMNSVGVASGGGVGRALAEWIVAGEPAMDLASVDVRRFSPFWNNLATLRDRAAESLSLHYALGYPGRERQTSRNLRLSPFHDRQKAHGAYFEERNGWERPSWFAPAGQSVRPELTFGRPEWFDCVRREHLAAREGVALFDRTSLGKILIQGRDAEAFLQRLCATDIARPGRAVYALMLNGRGGIESDIVLLREGPESWLATTGTAQVVRDMDWMRRHIRADECVTLADVTSAHAVIGLVGPKARDLLARISPADLADAAFPPFAQRRIDAAGTHARAIRMSYGGGPGYELVIASECALPIYDRLIAAGRDFGLVEAGAQALNCLRLEQGYAVWGHDIGPDDDPYSAGLGFLVDHGKAADFIGRHAAAAARARPLARRRMIVVAEDPGLLMVGNEPVFLAGRIVGRTTSAGFAHHAGRPVAQAYISLDGGAAGARDGAAAEIEVACRRHPVRLVLKGPLPPR
ncbi:MAG: FAD-dependent oxidoreductase [Rhodobacteraceae bacterium]|nr:FAD-dependent oxidoreductase [Paracoccaceae bacterium]